MQLRNTDGKTVRLAARSGEFTGPTSGLAMGYVQANLVVVPREIAYDFLLFCQRNPKPCPLLEVTETGSAEPARIAPGADLRTDLPAYRIYRNGILEEIYDISQHWQDDFVAFLLGCSFTFENALFQAGLPVRHMEKGCNVPMYLTNILCQSAGIFAGNMTVSMRPMTPQQAIRAVEICKRFPKAHGTPVHIGNPGEIGIPDVTTPDFGDRVDIRPGELPVFWACGVTPQGVAMAAKPPLLITHKPGHMFVSDLRDVDIEE